MTLFKKNKYLIIEIAILFLLSLIPFLWFKPNHVILGLDSGYAVDFILWLKQRIFTWLPSQNFGIDFSVEVGIVPYNALPAIIEWLGASVFNVQKILFSAWFFILQLSMYALASYIFPKKEQWPIRLFATIFYVFNLHLYSFWLQGEQPMLSSYAILPLFALLLLRFVREKSSLIRTAIYLNFVYLFFGSGGIRGLPLIGPVILTSLVIFLFFFFVTPSKKRLDYLKKFLLLGMYSGILLVLFNAYFLIPFITSFAIQYNYQVAGVGGIDGAIGWAKFISTHTSLINLFRLDGDNSWYGNTYAWSNAYLTSPILIVLSFLFPIFAFLAPLLSKEKRKKTLILFFAFLALVSLLLSSGAHPPFGYLYTFMMKIIPGFAAFRSAYYKFMPTVYFSFSILIGMTLWYFLGKFPKKIKNVAGITLLILLLVYNYPYFMNTNFVFNKPFSTMVKVPDYIRNFAQKENEIPDKFRTLVVPPRIGMSNIIAYEWGYWGSYPIFPLLTDRGFIVNDQFAYNDKENALITSLYDNLRNGDYKSFLNGAEIASVKYILYTPDIARDFVMSVTENPSMYLSILRDRNIFKKIWQDGPWQLYEIESKVPQKINTYGKINLSKGDFSDIDNVIYADALPFIQAQDVNLIKKIPIQGNLSNYSCKSCSMLDNPAVPSLISNNLILPNSKFYPLKLWLEGGQKNSLSENQKVDKLLGMSLKRMSELDALNRIDLDKENLWLISSNLLNSYWMKLDAIYENEYKGSAEYSVLNKILTYLKFEKSILSTILDNRKLDNKSKFGTSLISTIDIMGKIDSSLNAKLNSKNWKNSFVFDVSSSTGAIYLNPHMLAVDMSNNPIFPVSYEINGMGYPYVSNMKIPISQDGDVKILTLNFLLPNLFLQPAQKIIATDVGTKKCLFAPIVNYSGIRTYLVTAKISPENEGLGTMLIKRDYKIFKTQDLKTVSAKGLNPDFETSAYTRGNGEFMYQMTGAANDTGATIYFCTDKLLDPNIIFKDISVTELIHPQVYSYNDQSELQNKIPEITFSKIDPTNYKVTVKNATDPFVLSFSERFSPLWDAEIAGKKVSEHFLLNGYANGWYVENKGTYVINLTFKPQRWLQLGIIISCFAIVGSIIYLLFAFLNHVKNKNK